MGDESSPKRTTLLVVMLGITFALVVTGVMLLSQVRTKQTAFHAMCGKNQSQIMGALIAYSVQEEVAWPMPWALGPGLAAPKIADARAARVLTCRAFEILAATTTLPNALFRCSAARKAKTISLKPAADGRNGGRWGMGPDGVVMYAWDWASPADPSSARVVIADRDPLVHGAFIMACFGDAHVRRIKHDATPARRGPGTLETESLDGRAITVSVGNPEAGGDDIYSTEGDGEDLPEPDAKDSKPVPLEDYDPLAPTKGHPRRAWVK